MKIWVSLCAFLDSEIFMSLDYYYNSGINTENITIEPGNIITTGYSPLTGQSSNMLGNSAGYYCIFDTTNYWGPPSWLNPRSHEKYIPVLETEWETIKSEVAFFKEMHMEQLFHKYFYPELAKVILDYLQIKDSFFG